MREIGGVQNVELSAHNGWVKLSVVAKPDADVREDIFNLMMSKGWPMRELRREGATLEDFFVKVTAEHQGPDGL